MLEVAQCESLFVMAAGNRFDLFCRGANELRDEFESYEHIKGLAYDTSMQLPIHSLAFFIPIKITQRLWSVLEKGW